MARQVTKGISVSMGFGIGRIWVMQRMDPFKGIPNVCHASKDEINRLINARDSVMSDLEELAKRSPESSDIVLAMEALLDSIVNDAIDLIEKDGICAELAIKKSVENAINALTNSGSELIELRTNDLVDIATQLLTKMGLSVVHEVPKYNEGIIVVAEELYPSHLLSIARSGLRGIVTRKGGVTAHVAIMARSMGIPYIVNPDLDVSLLTKLNGLLAVINAYKGSLELIDEKERDRYLEIANAMSSLQKKYLEEKDNEAITIDGIKVNVLANIANLEEARLVIPQGGEGVGLLRLEFLYMDKTRPPSLEELYNILVKISGLINNRELIVRALDAGGDKPIQYLRVPKENNPFLGLRGIRLLLKEHIDILYDEIKAVILASSINRNIKFMIPMVSTLNEVKETKKIFIDIFEDMRKQKQDIAEHVDFGIMVETPSIALLIDKVVKYVDFVSLGTNDLTQYTIAVDRGNEKVQYLYSELNPAILRLIKYIVDAANKAGVRVDVCGEMAGNEISLPLLLALGIRHLSMNPALIPRAKYLIRRINVKELRTILLQYLESAETAEEVEAKVLSIMRSHIPEYYYLFNVQ